MSWFTVAGVIIALCAAVAAGALLHIAAERPGAFSDWWRRHIVDDDPYPPDKDAVKTPKPDKGAFGLATGGKIVGPGTGTSDTAGLFALSNGEYVIRAASVAKYGQSMMDAGMRAARQRHPANRVTWTCHTCHEPLAGPMVEHICGDA